MSLLLDKIFASIAWSHFMIDVLNGQRFVLLAYLSGPLGLTNTVIGSISTAYQLLASLAQPVFGYLTDRLGPRWAVAGGVFWMAGFFALAATIPGKAALVFLVIASLGSGAFHPAGAAEATLQGRLLLSGRETTAASFFFMFGQLGYFFGPLAGGPLLDLFGPLGLVAISVIALPAGISSAYVLRPAGMISRRKKPVEGTGGKLRLNASAGVVAALVGVAAFQSWGQANMNTFLPKYLSDLGYAPSAYGAITALFMGGSALGNVIGGNLADRFGKRGVVMLALILASAPFALVGLTGDTPWLFLLVPVAGLFSGAAYSVIVVFAQNLVPGGAALVSGLVLGFMFSSGAVGTLASGSLADHYGMPLVFFLSAAISLAGGLLAVFLSGKRSPA